MNTANTAVIRVGDRLLALWEGGSAYEIDPDDLRSRGPVTWRDDQRALPFSAHPLMEPDGTMWNFGSLVFLGGSGLIIWRISADGRSDVKMLESDMPGYLHSFAMSERHLIFVLMPIQREEGQAFYEGMRFAGSQPCRVAGVPKDALDEPRWLEADFSAVWHFADAWECAGCIGVHAVRHRAVEEARSPMAAAMRGDVGSMDVDTELVTLRIDLSKRSARWDRHGLEGIEFPTWNACKPGTTPARLFMPASIGQAEAPYFNGVVAFDPATNQRDAFRFKEHVMTEECRFVPRPGARRAERDGWSARCWTTDAIAAGSSYSTHNTSPTGRSRRPGCRTRCLSDFTAGFPVTGDREARGRSRQQASLLLEIRAQVRDRQVQHREIHRVEHAWQGDDGEADPRAACCTGPLKRGAAGGPEANGRAHA